MDIADAQSFFILGSAKCGSTSLYHYVGQHPDVFFSTPKEPIFFEAEYERGLDFYREKYFQGWSGEPAVGDARTHNLMLPYIPDRLRESLPDAKLIAILRDPVDRAYSHWWHRHSRLLERLELRGALEVNLEHIAAGIDFSGPDGAESWRCNLIHNRTNTAARYGLYLDLGYYALQLRRFLSLFPSSQLEVVLFEDLSRDPEATTRGLWRFLELDDRIELEDAAPQNTAIGRVRRPSMALLEKLPRPEFLGRLVPGAVKKHVSLFLLGKPAVRPPMKAEDERWLLDHFAPHNRALEELLGRDLPTWFEPQERRTRASEPATGDD